MIMDTILIRKFVSELVNDSRLAEINDKNILLFFTVLADLEILDVAVFLDFNDVVSDIEFLVNKISDKERKRILLDGLHIFNHEINNVSNNTLLIIWRRITDLLIITDAKLVFEELIYQLNSIGRNNEASHISEEVNKLIESLCNFKAGFSIYNPFAGLGSFSLNLPQNSFYLGEEINVNNSVIANLRLLINGKIDFAIIKNVNSLNRFENNLDLFTSEGVLKVDYTVEEGRKFDIAISIPPINLKGRDGKSLNTRILMEGIALINDTGKLIYTFSHSALGEKPFQELLMELCAKDILEGIVSLPARTFHQIGIKTCIIVINRAKKNIGKVRIVDANVFIDANRGNKEAIKFDETLDAYSTNSNINGAISIDNDNLLSFQSFYPENIIYQILTPQIENGVEFGDLILIEKQFLRNLNEDSSRYPRVNFSDLNNNIKLDYRNIKIDSIKKNDLILNSSCFLIGTFNGQLKFSYFKFEEEIHICSGNMIAVIVDEEKIRIPYFAKQLTENYLQEQIRQATKGSAIQRVSKSDLLKVKIVLLNFLEQKQQEDGILKFFHDSDRNLQLLSSLEDQLYEQTVYLRHSIAGPTRNILSLMKKMMLIIDNNPDKFIGEIANAKLNSTDRYSFKDMREIVERDLIKVENVVKNQLDIQQQIADSKLQIMDIDAFLADYTHNLQEVHPQITIAYESFVPYLLDDIAKEDYVTILGNQELLSAMLDNLFENARQHAFDEGIEKKFFINLNYDEDTGKLYFEVANSGKNFPIGFGFKEFITKNKKSNESNGNGFGGWYIFQVIKHHNGSLEIVDNTIFKSEIAEGYATSFYIQLPLLQD